MKLARRMPRRGFTLLEVLLASLIAIMLLAALYFMMDMTIRRTQEGREAVEGDNLTRNVFNRMTIDLGAALGPMPPKSGGGPPPTASSTTPPSTSSTTPPTTTPPTTTPPTTTPPASGMTTAPMSGATTPPATGTAAAAPTATTTAPTATTTDPTTTMPPAADVGFQAGVVGTDKQLTIFLSRVPAALADSRGLTQAAADASVQNPSDLIRVCYWLGSAGGLCRQERPWVTADGVRNSTDPDLSDEAGDTIVEEVKDVTFEYFDGTSWTSSWDGSTSGADSSSLLGPPRAIRVTLVLEIPATRPGGQPIPKTVVQVIPVRSAPGSVTPTVTDPYATGTSSSSSGSGTAMGGGTGTGTGMGGATGGATGGTGTGTTGGTAGSKTGGTTGGTTGSAGYGTTGSGAGK